MRTRALRVSFTWSMTCGICAGLRKRATFSLNAGLADEEDPRVQKGEKERCQNWLFHHLSCAFNYRLPASHKLRGLGGRKRPVLSEASCSFFSLLWPGARLR